jgi:DNA-binding MarR family transcriptional regulator
MDRIELLKQIVYNNRTISRVIHKYDPKPWMDLDLTIAQVKSLFFIADTGSVNFSALAAALRVTKSNVTGIIDRLVQDGLVSRTEKPEDRRMLMLQLTPKGEELVNLLRDRRIEQISAMLQKFTVEDLEIIARGQELLAKAAQEYTG